MLKKFKGESWRINAYRYFVIVFCSIIVFRLFQIQVLNASKYKAQAREQQWQEFQLQARRGNILTSDGYPVATSQVEYGLILNLKKNKDEINIPKLLSQYISDIDKELILNAQKAGRTWVTLKSTIDLDSKRTIEEIEELRGVVNF